MWKTGDKASPYRGAADCRKRCAHPLAPSARGLRPQAVGERTVRLSEIFRAMARFSPSAPSGHRSPSGASATSPVSGESVSQREVFRHAEPPLAGEPAERSDGLRGFSRSPQPPIFPSIFKQMSKFRPNFPAFCNNSETFVVIIDSTPFQKTSCRKEAPL